MVKLLIVRHGYSVSNKDKTLTGQSDVPLCKEGYKQAELVADYIVNNFKIDAIYSSDLVRSIDTIKPTAEKLNLPIITDKALREVYAGLWEDVKFDVLERDYNEEYNAWLKNRAFMPCPNGESLMDVHKRSLDYIKKVCDESDGKTIVIVTHGGVILPLQCFVQGVDMKLMHTVSWVPNASISFLNYENGQLQGEQFGFVEHLNGLVTLLNL